MQTGVSPSIVGIGTGMDVSNVNRPTDVSS